MNFSKYLAVFIAVIFFCLSLLETALGQARGGRRYSPP
jgi:hypothetical protein